MQAGKPDDAIKSVEEAQLLSKASGTAVVINQVAVASAHLQQVISPLLQNWYLPRLPCTAHHISQQAKLHFQQAYYRP